MLPQVFEFLDCNYSIVSQSHLNDFMANLPYPRVHEASLLAFEFPQGFYIPRQISLTMRLDIRWIAGFFDGEGSVCISVTKSKERKFGYQFNPSIVIDQNHKHTKILELIKNYFWLWLAKEN